MKKSLAAMALCLFATQTFAGEVPSSTLSSLGLGGMERISDAAGREVRGMSSNAAAMGLSLTFGQLVYIDQFGQNFVVASDVNMSAATAENAGLNAFSTASSRQGSGVFGNLSVLPSAVTPGFTGQFTGLAGDAANAFAGRAFATAN